MKYYILLIYLLAFSLATEGNTAVKDSLSEALPSASSPLQKLEIMTNLMDLSRQEEQVEYAKQLYWLALEEDEDYYKEVALTEILRFYVNTDAKDSAKVYLAEAERELKGKARDFLVTYMKTIMDVRVVYYTKGEDRMKLIEKYKLRLETEKDMPVLDKISNYYLLGMANSNRVDPKNQDAIYKEVCYYMNNLIELSDNIPLRYSYLFRLNTLNILSLMEATPENRVKASLRYLNMQKEYADTKEMKKRPYTSKRHLLNNANKFTNQGSITLSYQPEEEGKIMCICVTDTGCGIPADKSEWIFERFTKNDDFIPGSGLGLYLCRLITQRLNGSLKLDTCYTGGARFILRLPINPYK
ncbi:MULTISPECIES: sensor histidine kinase [Parabacteroides]|uniref:sensor histidine kinase n=1 Tax=Parabacteroides TaxID=375288 RepID=UPI00284C6B47|nr:ATP-binding protein [Parabacteroides sp.]MDR3858345.1 ATP-binding protein [Parabacteroides sp.]